MTAVADTRVRLRIGPLTLGSPVVLAPMAGITNAAFRQLCREQGGAQTALYVSEMVTSRALVERSPESMRLIQHGPGDVPRSVQLYGVDPTTVAQAVRLLVDEDRTDHIDLNFGCPVPKVTRKGGGAALPWKATLFRDVVRAAVTQAGHIPVTVKMRKGVDDDHLTYLDAGRTAQDEGVAAVSLHARTAAQHYAGHADWAAITNLKAALQVPVLGNGDIWSADDALRMVAETGCDGVVVGRGCLGRPWLFADLAAAFEGVSHRAQPDLREVIRTMHRHVELLTEHYDRAGDPIAERKACRDIRKHIAWYLKGFSVAQPTRRALALVDTMDELQQLTETMTNQPWPGEPAEGQRGRAGSPQRVALPDGWLDSRELTGASKKLIQEAELSVSGG